MIPPTGQVTIDNSVPFGTHITYNVLLSMAIYLLAHSLLYDPGPPLSCGVRTISFWNDSHQYVQYGWQFRAGHVLCCENCAVFSVFWKAVHHGKCGFNCHVDEPSGLGILVQ